MTARRCSYRRKDDARCTEPSGHDGPCHTYNNESFASKNADIVERDGNQMWINAFRLVNPSDETLRGIGADVANLLRSSRSRDRTDPLEPLMLVNLRIVAS